MGGAFAARCETRSFPFPATGAAPVSPRATGVIAVGVPMTTTRVVSPERSVTVVPPADGAVPVGTTLIRCSPNDNAIVLDGTPYGTFESFVWPSTTTSTAAMAATPGTTWRRPSVLPPPDVSGPAASSEQAARAASAGTSQNDRAFM